MLSMAREMEVMLRKSAGAPKRVWMYIKLYPEAQNGNLVKLKSAARP
jgi:hypothetical protein